MQRLGRFVDVNAQRRFEQRQLGWPLDGADQGCRETIGQSRENDTCRSFEVTEIVWADHVSANDEDAAVAVEPVPTIATLLSARSRS